MGIKKNIIALVTVVHAYLPVDEEILYIIR